MGEYMIVFGMLGETIDFMVCGYTCDSYVWGALVAVKFFVM